MLKISYKLMEPYRAKKRKKPVRHGYCRLCGSKLTDPKSIVLGIGRGCMGRHVAIVLEIVPDDLPNNASSGLVPGVAIESQVVSDTSR